MNKNDLIIFKPCLAYDALCAIAHSKFKVVREGEPYLKEYMAAITKGLVLPNSVSQISHILRDALPPDEIENLSIGKLSESFPDMIEKGGNEYIYQHKDDITTALKRMAKNDFGTFWTTHYHELLVNVCDQYSKWVMQYDLEALKRDIGIVRGLEDVGNIRVYVSYFSNATSYALTANTYVCGYSTEYPMTPDRLVCVLAHELCHGFMNDNLEREYLKLCESDDFLHRTHWAVNRNSFNEEEFVVAVENFLAVRNGLRTIEQARELLFIWFGSCMPVAALTFEQLILEKDVPRNMNEWFIECLAKRIHAGSVKEQVDAVHSGFSSNFQKNWENEDVFKEYKPLSLK